MAGDWIKWEVGLESKIEVIKMASELKKSRYEVAALCMVLWAWADRNISDDLITDNGSAFVSLSPTVGDNMALIDAVVGTANFADSLSRVGWLRFRGERIEFPNFGLHNGETAKTRARNAKNQQKKRSSGKGKKSPNTDEGHLQAVTSVTEMSPARGDKSVTREREEKSVSSIKETPPYIPPIERANPAVVSIEVGGEVITFDQDHLRWQAEFIRRWNALPGVNKYRMKHLDNSNFNALRARLAEYDWTWKDAFLSFPLHSSQGWMPSITWFLQPDSVARILDNVYARRPGSSEAGLSGSAGTSTRIRGGQASKQFEDAFAALDFEATTPEGG